MVTHTHIGCREHVGYVHCGSRLWGHHLPRPGKRHALNGGPARFTALCGEAVTLGRRFDEWGEEAPPNVRPVTDPDARPVTCKRCLRAIGLTGA
jgi:hypothetical protein